MIEVNVFNAAARISCRKQIHEITRFDEYLCNAGVKNNCAAGSTYDKFVGLELEDIDKFFNEAAVEQRVDVFVHRVRIH